jgi:hypothetical protein
VNGAIGETAVAGLVLNGLAGWVLAAYAIRRGWRVNTSPEKRPAPEQAPPVPGQADALPGPEVPAGVNGAAG